MKSGQYCGNPNCGISSGICGSTTFGSGKLDDYGYWENPCVICAAVTQRFTPRLCPVWPDPKEHAIPAWAAQATPGATLTIIHGAISMYIANIRDGVPLEKSLDDLQEYIDSQIKPLAEHLKYSPW